MGRAASIAVLCAGLLSCGDGSVTDCACFVNSDVVGVEIQLGCGESRCIGGFRYDCDEDVVSTSGTCSLDMAQAQIDTDGGCVPVGASCTPGGAACCGLDLDGGASAVSCSPETLACCVATGQQCRSSADCCGARACVKDVNGGTSHCGL